MQIKKIQDYYEKMYEMYPDVSKSDIKRIVTYGWKMLYANNSYGADVLISTRKVWCYFGSLTKNSIAHYYYYIKKLIIKLRILYNKRRVQYDGYYYFALTNRQYEEYLAQKKSKGRPKKYFNYGNCMLFKILDECKLKDHNRKYIFRVKIPVEQGFKLYYPNYRTGDAELIIVRDPCKFKDILVENCKYELIYGTKRNS